MSNLYESDMLSIQKLLNFLGDEAILDGVKEKLFEGFRNEEEFGYMAGYEPWEKLIFDR